LAFSCHHAWPVRRAAHEASASNRSTITRERVVRELCPLAAKGPDSEWIDAVGKHYSGKVTVARDGQIFDL
jgi:hypothetical protein